MTTSVNEDEVIKKRLLIEGDSGNEDRCINKLIKLFIKYCQNTPSEQQQQQQQDDDFNDLSNAHEMMLAVMSHIEFGLMRNQFIFEMNKYEQENFDSLYKNIDFDIEKAKRDIVQSKLDLEEARKIRKNRQEYDVLAHEINKFPDRQEMQATIERLERQLENLKESKADLNHKIDLRRKQFSVLLKSISSMKCLLESDQYNDISQLDNETTLNNTTRMEVSEVSEQAGASAAEKQSHRSHHHHRHHEDSDGAQTQDDEQQANKASKMELDEKETW